MAGDFSPLAIDSGHAGARFAPPGLIVAAAIGLGSMDMPVPSVERWEWLNWKFPRAVRAGDTIYARWTLTQKRPPIGSEPNAIVVWRVDVHTGDGVMCAEGEVGAAVRRVARARAQEAPAAQAQAPRRRRGRRTAKAVAEPAAPPPVEAPTKPAPAEKAGSSRRRRRRRPRTPGASQNGPSAAVEAAPEARPAPVAAPVATAAAPAGALSRVIKRLRRT